MRVINIKSERGYFAGIKFKTTHRHSAPREAEIFYGHHNDNLSLQPMTYANMETAKAHLVMLEYFSGSNYWKIEVK